VTPQFIPPFTDKVFKFLSLCAFFDTSGNFGITEDVIDPAGKVSPLLVELE
jgi:hypothetical protein